MDMAIIQTRHRMLRAAWALREHGTIPPGVNQQELYRVRSCAVVLPDGAHWRVALDDWLNACMDQALPAQAAVTVA
jgi:hypothetical protein